MNNIYFVLFCIIYLSLMRTECPDTCDGKDACNETSKECLKGCVKGKYGPVCDRDCPTTCELCNRVNGTCTSNIESSCTAGFHGKQCTLACPTTCRTTDCDRSTGNCSGGCQVGYGGMLCDKECNNCAGDGSCSQIDLRCLSGCASGYKGKICSLLMSSDSSEDYNVLGIVLTTIILLIGLCISLSSFALRFRLRNLRPSISDEE